jgi:hypothetical protein
MLIVNIHRKGIFTYTTFELYKQFIIKIFFIKRKKDKYYLTCAFFLTQWGHIILKSDGVETFSRWQVSNLGAVPMLS